MSPLVQFGGGGGVGVTSGGVECVVSALSLVVT